MAATRLAAIKATVTLAPEKVVSPPLGVGLAVVPLPEEEELVPLPVEVVEEEVLEPEPVVEAVDVEVWE